MWMSILLLSLGTADAVPLQLTQQGRMIDSAGSAITGLHILTFRVYDDVNTGNMLWEDYMTADFVNGYYAAVLGADVQNNPLDSSVLSLYPLYLEIQLDNNSPLSPRTEISSAPYAQIAGIAESVEGGTVDASEISIGGNAVIDSAGLWVGQPLTVDWANVQNIPSDIADGDANTQLSETQVEGYINNGAIDLHPLTTMNGSGLLTQADTLSPDWTNITNRPAGLDDGDDDALSGLGCAQGEIVGWDGLNWVCTSDNNLSESEVEAYITNGIIDLAVGSTVGGLDILTSDSDTLANLNCMDGEFPRWDGVSMAWICTSDLDSTTTIAGEAIVSSAGCNHGEVLSYNSSTSDWECASFQSLLDSDGDGVMAWADCDDSDSSVLSSANDADCDGVSTALDCDDNDPNSNTVAQDADCDGALTADDCDDSDPNVINCPYVNGFNGDLGPDLSAQGFQQCGGAASVSVMGHEFYELCEGYSEIRFACSSNNDNIAEYISPVFSLSGVTLRDGQCDNWSGGANTPYGSDYILSIDSSNPGCSSYSVGYDMYVHFGAQWGCNGYSNSHSNGGHMWAYVR